MNKLVIINFDDQYINTSSIICNSLNKSLFVTMGNTALEISVDDVLSELDKPIDILINNVLSNYDIKASNTILNMVKLDTDDYFYNASYISNGLQEFINECSKNNCKIVIISNKNIEVVEQVVKKYTPYSVNKVVSYNDSKDAINLIKKLQEEYKINNENTMLISHTDFGDENLKMFEYSKEYCGNHIFNDYLDLLPLIDDKNILMPSIQVSLNIEVEDRYLSDVIDNISNCCFQMEVTDIKNSNNKLIAANRTEIECVDSDDNMYAEKIMEDVLELFFKKKKILKQIQKEYVCKITLSVVVNMISTKVNPCISPSKKVIKFLGDTNIDIDYDVYSL